LSNESSGIGKSGREESEEESAKRRRFLSENEMPDSLGEEDEQDSDESRVPKVKRAPHEPTNDEIRLMKLPILRFGVGVPAVWQEGEEQVHIRK